MKQPINEIRRMQQLAAIKELLNEESVPAAQWKLALVNFIQTNLTEDIAELDMLNDVLRDIIADNEQEIADNQDYLAYNESQLNEAEDFLSPKMEKKFNMVVSALKKSKTEDDFNKIHNTILFMPDAVSSVIFKKLEKMGLVTIKNDEVFYNNEPEESE